MTNQSEQAYRRSGALGRAVPMAFIATLLLAALWGALGMTGAAHANLATVAVTAGVAGPATIPDPTADVTLTGAIPGSQLGFAVSPAGDVNGDGIEDLLVGAAGTGQAHVYTGTVDGLSDEPFFSTESYSGRFGYSVAGSGRLLSDFDGNGVDDFLVGAPDESLVRVYTSTVGDLPALAITLTSGVLGDSFGWAVAVAGDLNGDTYGDVVVGAWEDDEAGGNAGKIYIYHGGPDGFVLTPTLVISGTAAGDGFGVSVAGLGDVDRDGYDDIAVGAWQDGEAGTDAGKVIIYYGSENGIDPDNKTTLLGEEGIKFGTSVHAAGDVNGDGYADLVVGADAYSVADPAPGRVYVFLGSDAGIVPTPILVATGESDNDRFGFAVSGGGDLNGDGFADVVVGASEFGGGDLSQSGKAYAYAGCLNGMLPDLLFSTPGEAAQDNFGRSLTIAGDLNNDGYDDLVVGAWRNAEGGFNAGKAYVYYGGPVDVCAAKVAVTKTVGLTDYPPACGPSTAILTPTNALTVPVNTPVTYCYTVENTGNLTLTQHSLFDDGPGLGELFARVEFTLTPGMTYTHAVTRVASATPGALQSGTVTWTATVSITAPGDAPTLPANAVITATASATGAITSSPASLDQDGDGVPDNEEGASDANQNGIPAYLDPDEPGLPDDGAVYLPAIVR